MERLIPSHVNKMGKRDAYYKVLDFINSNRCYDGKVCILYGLRSTGKTTIMEQIMTENSDKWSFLFLEATKQDTMHDVYSILDEAVANHINCVFIDEITNISDFIDDSEMLSEYYAKVGIRIILSGYDSLNFAFAEEKSLYCRTEIINTTYISFEEHCRVLGTKDMDDYISYGGLMKKGINDHFVYDYESSFKYLVAAVSGNIYRSLQNYAHYANHVALMDVTLKEMCIVIEKFVKKYSGVFNAVFMNEDTLKVLVEAINADARIVHKFDEDMVNDLGIHLLALDFISVTSTQEFIYEEGIGWNSSSVYKEYYVIQPAIKYYHLKKALESAEMNQNYLILPEAKKQLVMLELDSKIREEMTKQIVVYEMSKALSKDQYFVCKVTFFSANSDKNKGEYDMLIYDRTNNSYYVFAIRHVVEPDDEQYCHLVNEKFREIIDFHYGNREGISVLYNGTSFMTQAGVAYLNILDFVQEVTRCKDIRIAMQNLIKKYL